MKKKGFLKYILVVAVAILVVLAVRLFAGGEDASYTVPRPAVTVARPVRGNMTESLVLNGHVEARSMIPVIPLVSGTILEYPARAGVAVEEGQLLAQIDPEPFRQQMLQAQAAYTGYDSSFRRVEGLYQAGAATRQEYDTLKSQRDAAKAQYDLAVLQLGYASVSSPVAGTILAAPLSAGSVAAAPQPVAVVADLSDLVVRLHVPEKYFSLFTQNRHQLRATVIRPESEVSAAAVLDTIAPYIDGASKTFEIMFKLEADSKDFSPGMFVRVNVVFASHPEVALLPVTALTKDGALFSFEAVEGETESEEGRVSGVTRLVPLKSALSDNQWIVVPEEYSQEAFVVAGQGNVLAGQPVEGSWVELHWQSASWQQPASSVEAEQEPSFNQNPSSRQEGGADSLEDAAL